MSNFSKNGIDRRTVLKLGTGAAAIAAGSIGFKSLSSENSSDLKLINSVEPFFGKHQAGIATYPQEHATWVAYKLKPETDRDALRRLMRLWTTDAARLSQGQQALADNESTLASGAANLTITFGFGPDIVATNSVPMFHQIPTLVIDQLQEQWSGGDLLIQVCANDQIKVHHAVRELTNDAKPFANLLWQQTGFLPSIDLARKQTPRNLMGQKDGTANFSSDTAEFENTVWINQGPAAGGTIMVIRRIAMDLEKWETLSPDLKSKSIGRDIETGAPLSGGDEFTPVDLELTDHHGLVIPGDSHVRRARLTNARIHRRGYNYRTESSVDTKVDQGLIFVSFQASLRQFMQIQTRLEAMDSLNTWTTPIGSAVFLIPPGIANGEWIGQTII